MSRLNDESISIYQALQHIQERKYVMPAFQRQYVWHMGQIEKLWDSILLDYPISTFLFWQVDHSNVTWDTYFCNFLDKATFDSKKQADSMNYELTGIRVEENHIAVLDGQQRLTSLYLSLMGEVSIRPRNARKSTGALQMAKLFIQLDKDKVTVDEEEYSSKKYDISFSDKVGKVSPTQFEIKTILQEDFAHPATRGEKIQEILRKIPTGSKDYAQGILEKLCSKVYDETLIRYTEIAEMNQEDALEMFVRFNSGGKPLRKFEITMSILEAYWPSAKREFGNLLQGEYEHFGTDFLIRTALLLYGDVVKSNINKKVAEDLKNNWADFCLALLHTKEVLGALSIDIRRFSSSWNVLLPVIYFVYYNPDYGKNQKDIKAYILRAIFFTYFSSGTTGKLQQMKSRINDNEVEITIEMLEQINELRVTEGKIEDILLSQKGSRVAGEVLYYLSVDWRSNSFFYEQDHLHPSSRFDGSKPPDISMEDWRNWRGMRDRLPNLHLLEGRSNGSKNDMRLLDYFNDKNQQQQQDFYAQALVPEGTSLEFHDFETFYATRKEGLARKIKELLG